jgi:hypothetical protein
LPNNREWAIIVWVGVLVGFTLLRADLRGTAAQVLKSFLQSWVLSALVLTTVWIFGEVIAGKDLRIWSTQDVTDTCIWFVSSALVLFVTLTSASEKDRFFLRNLRSLATVAFVLGFFVNLFVFPFAVEVILLPIELLLIGVSVVAPSQQHGAQVKKLTDGLIVSVGAALIINSTVKLTDGWDTLNKAAVLRSLLLPVWLTLALLPMVYLLGLGAQYQLMFVTIDLGLPGNKTQRYLKFAIVTNFWFRAHTLERFGKNHQLDQVRNFRTIREARIVVRGLRDGSDAQDEASSDDSEPTEALRRGLISGTGGLGEVIRKALTLAMRQRSSDETPEA